MFIKRRQLLIAVAAVPGIAWAQTARPVQEGKDFRPPSRRRSRPKPATR